MGPKVEWRYRNRGGGKEYYALIYRVIHIPWMPDAGRSQQLVVVRLDGERSCILGVIPQSADMNGRACRLADDAGAACSPEHRR